MNFCKLQIALMDQAYGTVGHGATPDQESLVNAGMLEHRTCLCTRLRMAGNIIIAGESVWYVIKNKHTI